METPLNPNFYAGANAVVPARAKWANYAKPGGYTTNLSPDEEAQFQNWVSSTKVPWQDSPTSDYDMRGYWKAQQAGDANAKTQINAVDNKPHYPDTYKTPFHNTFSNESQYALPTAGHWQGQNFISPATPDPSWEPFSESPNISASAQSQAFMPRQAQPDLVNDVYMPQLRDAATRYQTALDAPHSGTLRQVLGAFLSRRNPTLGGVVSGELGRQRNIQSAGQDFDLINSIVQQNRAMQNQDITNKKNIAETNLYNAHANSFLNPPLKPKEEDWNVVPNVLGPNGEPVQIEKNSGQTRLLPLPGATVKDANDTKGGQLTDINIAGKNHKVLVNTKDGSIIKDMGESKLPNDSGTEGTWTLQEDEHGKTVLFNGKTGQIRPAPAGLTPKGSHKPNASEKNRSDLADNLNENLDALEEIVNRRPDLFGPVAGRRTQLKAYLGSNDPDIGKLDTIKHQLGMVQQSTHGMRSAYGVQSAAASVLNDFKNGPAALKGSISAARNSAQTFKKNVADVQSGAATGSGTEIEYDAQGNRVNP